MKHIKLFLFFILFNIGANHLFSQTTENSILGNWYCEDLDKSTIQVYQEKSGTWYAKVIKSSNAKNLNKILFSDGVYNQKENNYKSTLVHPTMGVEISSIMTLNGKILKIVGKKFLITKMFYWIKL
jgi:hypothetical protein